MRMVWPVIALGTLLAGCGAASRFDANTNYQTSVAAYKRCLEANPPMACESLRLAMEADERRYSAMMTGSQTVTVLSR